jgi:uncharacterized protein YabN with tetrapyrrole methylase and pyrophosphatase domain
MPAPQTRRSGSLVVVGTGIKLVLQATPEARYAIERADKVLYLFADPVPRSWIERLNGSAQSLDAFYAPGKSRRLTYEEMVDEILGWVRKELNVCAVFYGHPGIFVHPSHHAIVRARQEGFSARMLPAVSAEDCLFADLEVDPGDDGCQSFEATSFLLYPRRFDTSTPLILWQVSVIGQTETAFEPNRIALDALVERLGERYGPDHEVVLYEAAQYPVGGPTIERLPLGRLAEAPMPPLATLYVPPIRSPEPDLNVFDRLGISRPPPHEG